MFLSVGNLAANNRDTPLPDWKKIDKLQPILPPKEQGEAEIQGGTITVEEMIALDHGKTKVSLALI